MKYFVLVIERDVEPVVYGPFQWANDADSTLERDKFAYKHKQENGDEDGIFSVDLDWDNAVSPITINSYPASFFEGKCPEAEETVVDELVEKYEDVQFEESTVDPSDLDEYVHDACSAEASACNNAGVRDQIQCLVKKLGAANARKIVNQAIAKGT